MPKEHRKKILLVLGTRPDAIKMCPVATRLKGVESFDTRVCVTAQHRDMLDQALGFFGIAPDYDLGIMTHDQDLCEVTTRAISGIREVLKDFKPDCVLVHGDTTTTLAASLSAFYMRIKVGHVEAGLRSKDRHSPYPEEANRRVAGVLSDFHFAPTNGAMENLLREGINGKDIIVTGNTAIDSLFFTIKKIRARGFEPKIRVKKGQRLVLVTAHRRENFGKGIENICLAMKDLAKSNEDILILYPVHPNPNIKGPVKRHLSAVKNIMLVRPLDYPDFVYLMDNAYIIITDSGGIQEEAPSLGKPVLVLRDVTERPEAVEAGTARLVGTARGKIVAEAQALLDSKERYNFMVREGNPYGDGKASDRIARFLKKRLN